MENEKSLMDVILETTPLEVINKIKDKKCTLVGFGAGPAFAAQYKHKFKTSVDLNDAFKQLEKYWNTFKMARIVFDSGETLFFV